MLYAILWLLLFVGLVVLESSTMQLICIWFGIGSIAGFIAALCGAAFHVQMVWFVLVSAVLLLCVRPLARKAMKGRYTPTNVDALAGEQVIVSRMLEPGLAEVTLRGVTWQAVCPDLEVEYAPGTRLRVAGVEGNKLIITGR